MFILALGIAATTRAAAGHHKSGGGIGEKRLPTARPAPREETLKDDICPHSCPHSTVSTPTA
jgi:hypothetical protein